MSVIYEISTMIRKKYDVIVVGGGIAGIAASVSAARDGAKVLLLEKQVNLGGLATSGLISWYEPLCDPTSLSLHKVTALCLEPAERILDGSCHHMVYAGHTVC